MLEKFRANVLKGGFLLLLFTVLKMISLCANCSTAKNNSKKQNNRCDFLTFFRFSDFIIRLGKNSQAKIFIVAFIE